jgi:hypothetical protein
MICVAVLPHPLSIAMQEKGFVIVHVARVPGYRSRGPGFNSRYYKMFLEIVGLERGPLSLVSTTEELLGRKRSDFDLETRENSRRARRADHATPSIRKS